MLVPRTPRRDMGILFGCPLQGPSNEEIEETLKRVFADQAFDWSPSMEPNAQDNWLPFLIKKFFELINHLVGYLDSIKAQSPTLFWILFSLLALIALLLLVHIGKTLAMGFRFAFTKDEETSSEGAEQRKLRSGELRAKARELAIQGAGGEAVRFLLLSMLAFLEEKHILQVARGWTNREIFKHLEKKIPTEENWSAFEGRVERVSYAGEALSIQNFEKIENSLDVLLGLKTTQS
jgi:hypothetical protein